MKFFIVIIIFYIVLPAFALAEVYSWVDVNGVKHFSNHPPPSGAHSVRVVEELRSPDPPIASDKPKASANHIAPTTTKSKKSAITPQAWTEDTQRKGNTLVLKEQQKLDLKLKALNQQLVEAEQARFRGSSYDYQDWTIRIEQIQDDIDNEKQRSSQRIQRIKSQYSMD